MSAKPKVALKFPNSTPLGIRVSVKHVLSEEREVICSPPLGIRVSVKLLFFLIVFRYCSTPLRIRVSVKPQVRLTARIKS